MIWSTAILVRFRELLAIKKRTKKTCYSLLCRRKDQPYLEEMVKRSREDSPSGQQKQQRCMEPEVAKRKFVTVTLHWEGAGPGIPNNSSKGKPDQHRRKARMMLDCGANVPILNDAFTRERGGIPCHTRNNPMPATDAAGREIQGTGKSYTSPLIMRVGEHQEELAWEVGPLEEGIDGYLPVGWFVKHNPDIDWERNTVRWRS